MSAQGACFCFPFVFSQAISGISYPYPRFGEMLILVIGLCPACMSRLIFHRAPGAQVVLGRRRLKGGKGQGGRSGLPWGHVILLSAGGLFLVNVSVGRLPCCCAAEGPGQCAAQPAATFIMTILTLTLIMT